MIKNIIDKISSRQELIFYAVLVIMITLCIAVASILSNTAHGNRNEFPYTAMILNTDCKYIWNKKEGYYDTIIYFILVYTVDSVKYIQKYKADFFTSCETSTWGGGISTCCENMIGDNIWFNIIDKNITDINELSVMGNNSSGTLITFAFVFYFFSLLGLLLLFKTGYVHYTDGYLNFSSIKRVPLLNENSGL